MADKQNTDSLQKKTVHRETHRKTASKSAKKTPEKVVEKAPEVIEEVAAQETPVLEEKPAPKKKAKRPEGEVKGIVNERRIEAESNRLQTPQIDVVEEQGEKPEREVILSVRHLKQYFKLGGTGVFKYNKAVHDVTFDVYRGEVFGLVGESGCGKTTIGRSIIRLYEPTSGNIYFKGVRIGAGTRWNEKEIKYTRIRLNQKLKELASQEKEELEAAGSESIRLDEIKAKYAKLREEESAKANEIITREKANIASAHYDMKHVDKDFAKDAVKKVEVKYADLLNRTNNLKNVSSEDEEAVKLYRDELRMAKKARITSGMQMIFQDPMASINPRMTVRDIISEGLRINGVHDRAYIKKRVDEMLDKVGLLPEHADRYPHEFSGGQRQRIGIARALIMNPELIIADEPVSALDVSIQAQIINLLNDLREELGLTILFIAHNLSVVKYFCDRIAVMYFGNLVELASSDELFRHPLHPYTRSLLSAVPHCDPDTEKNRTRVKYDPKADHDYSEDKPRLVELEPGHFVLCNKAEEKKYRDWLAKGYDSGYGR